MADLTGDALAGALAGRVTLLKISEDELLGESRAAHGKLDSSQRAMAHPHRRGAQNLVLSRAAAVAVAFIDGPFVELVGPQLTPADPRGAGDSMTGATAAGIAHGLGATDWLRLAAAAGAVNATRHGLGTGARTEIEQVAKHIKIRP